MQRPWWSMKPGPARQAAKAEYEKAHPLPTKRETIDVVRARINKLIAAGEELLRQSEKHNGTN